MKTLISNKYAEKFKEIVFDKLYKKCINKKSNFNGLTYFEIYKEVIKESYSEFKKIMQENNIETELFFRHYIENPFANRIVGVSNYYNDKIIDPNNLKSLYETCLKFSSGNKKKNGIHRFLFNIKDIELTAIMSSVGYPKNRYISNIKNTTGELYDEKTKEFFNMLLFEGCYLYIKDGNKSRIYFVNKYLDITPISAKNFIDFFSFRIIDIYFKKKKNIFITENPFSTITYTEDTHTELNEILLSDKLKNLILSVNHIIEKHGFINVYFAEKKYYYDSYFKNSNNKKERVYYKRHNYVSPYKILFNISVKEKTIDDFFKPSITFSIFINLSRKNDVKISIYNDRCSQYTRKGEFKYYAKLCNCLDEIQSSKTIKCCLDEIINTKKNMKTQKYKLIKEKYDDMLKHGISGFCVKEKYSDDDIKLIAPYYEDFLFKIE